MLQHNAKKGTLEEMCKIGEDPNSEVHAKFTDCLRQRAIEKRQRPTRQIVAALRQWLMSHQNGEGEIELPVHSVALGQDRDKEPTLYGGLDEKAEERRNNGMAKNVHRSSRA